MVADAFQSEMTAFADLVLPDTTYLERHDAMSMLDRPISEFDGPCDSVRVPVVPPLGQCKPFQEVLVELASRLKLPAFTTAEGSAQVQGLPGLHRPLRNRARLGHRLSHRLARQGRRQGRCAASPTRRQWEHVRRQQLRAPLPHAARVHRYMRNWNRGYLLWAQRPAGLHPRRSSRSLIHLYSEVHAALPARGAGQGIEAAGRQPPDALRERVATYFDPLPFWYEPLEVQATDAKRYPLAAVTQRPMAMYHSWDSQNAWLRQIHAHNELFVNPKTALAQGIGDGDWMWVESHVGQGALPVPLQRGGGAGHGVDLERHRQGQGRLGAVSRTPMNRARASCSTT